MKTKLTLIGLLALNTAAFQAGATVTNFTWTGASSSSAGSAANWVVDQPIAGTAAPRAPGSFSGNDFAAFNAAAVTNNNRNVDLGSSQVALTAISFNFASGANAFTFNASGLASQSAFGIQILPGGMINNDTDAQIFNVPITLVNTNNGALTTSVKTTLNAGSGGLNFTGNWTNAAAGVATLNLNGGQVIFTGNADTTIGTSTTDGIISGAGQITKNGAGSLNLNGDSANTYTGPTTITAGKIAAGKVNALGSGSAISITGGILDIDSFNQSVGTFTLNGGIFTGGSGILTPSSILLQNGSVTGTLGGTAAATKSSANTVTISSANTFTGGTTITAGRLNVNNSTGSGLGTGNVAVNNGGTLAGIGFISGSVTNGNGSRISPGSGTAPGTLTVGSLSTWKGGATLTFNINAASGTAGTDPGWGLLNVNGTLVFTANSGSKFTIDVTSLTLGDTGGTVSDFSSGSSYDWLFLQTTSGISGLLASQTTNDFTILTSNFQNSTDGGTFNVVEENGNKELHLIFTPVPEPSSLALGCLVGGFGLMLGFVFKRDRR